MKLDETRIQHFLSNNLINRGHEIVVPNVSWSWLSWEADLISITKAGYMNEFEIKCTRQDFQNDFKKRKHNVLRRCSFSEAARVPSKFWYVAPLAAVPVCVPDHAGLILVEKTNQGKFERINIEEIKKAPQIHRHKVSVNCKIAVLRTMMFKYWDLARTLNTIKLQKELFTN